MDRKNYIQTLKEEIQKLKEKRNAVILAHSYQRPEIQDIADFVGSSLQLAQKAQSLDCDTIIFAGVDFMANTAKILNPDKTVLIPDNKAECPLAKMLTPEDIIKAKKKYSKAPVLLYTNTSAECQALADIIYTAGNAIDIVNQIAKESGSDVIIFGPDVNMAYFVGKRLNCRGKVKTNRGIKSVKGLEQGERLLYLPSYGVCGPHVRILPENIKRMRNQHPLAKVLVHSECYPQVQELSDFVGSTGDMVRYVKESEAEEFIIGTERDFCYKLKKEVPNKTYYSFDDNLVCPQMKLHTLDKIMDSLTFNLHEVTVPEETSRNARKAIEAMLRA